MKKFNLKNINIKNKKTRKLFIGIKQENFN